MALVVFHRAAQLPIDPGAVSGDSPGARESNRLFFVMKWAYLRALAALAGLASGGLALLASVWLGATCDFRRSRRDGKDCAIISLQGGVEAICRCACTRPDGDCRRWSAATALAQLEPYCRGQRLLGVCQVVRAAAQSPSSHLNRLTGLRCLRSLRNANEFRGDFFRVISAGKAS
jgi:hypothetical protein